MADPTFQRLFPAAEADVDAATYVNALSVGRAIPANRPLVMVNMVGTLDGNASFDGRSAPLSDPGDRALFHALRGSADAIMAGTGTLAVERYRPAGKPIVTRTRSGRLPNDIPLLADRDGRAIVFSGGDVNLDGVAAEVSVEPLTDLTQLLETLRQKYGIHRLLCEGGPGLFGAMIRTGLVDELFLTLAPKLVGGTAGPALTSGDPAPQLTTMRLASILARESTVFLRYERPV